MKKMKLYFLLIPYSFLLFSCVDDEINMLTKINPDGSCVREFTQEGDSAFLVGDTAKSNPFSFNLDSSWRVSWKYKDDVWSNNWPLEIWHKDTSSKKKVFVKATKEFQVVSDVNDFNYYELTSWKVFNPQISLNKKFQWFNTFYTYKEKYLKYNPFNHVPITDFMTEDEISLWFQGNVEFIKGMNGVTINDYLSEVEKGYNNWIDRNIFEEQFSIVLEHVHLLEDEKLTKEFLISNKDSIYQLNKHEYLEGDLLDLLDKVFGTNKFETILGKEAAFDKYDETLEELYMIYGLPIEYGLIMPGKVYQTNALIRKADTLIWKLDAYRFTINDYEIYAESRKPNIWAFVVSGIFILGVVLSYFVSFRGKS